MTSSAHLDSFARDRLPPPSAQPRFVFEGPGLQFPERLNCAVELLDAAVERKGWGGRIALRAPGGEAWTYRELREHAHRIAHVLVDDLGLVPGQRVLLRGCNTPMLAACWFGVMAAGGIAVTTMPLLRAAELTKILAKAEVSHALCEAALRGELDAARAAAPSLRRLVCWGDARDPRGLEALMAARPASFTPVDTAAADVALLAFTSGTTGTPKATMHFHRDVMAACACWPVHVLKAAPEDLFVGSPPLGFTFGLGGLLLFPLAIGAASLLLPKAGPAELLEAIEHERASVLFTAPTSYRAMAEGARERRLGAPQGGPLSKCVSAGEVLPAATRALWKEATGLEIIDGIGATELLHIFISADEAHARPGATGTVVPGYRAKVVDEAGREVGPGVVGRLAVQGPTGCRYLDDPVRQAQYVQDGWNLTGDAYERDADGYFRFHSRTDDMIVSAGYNIAAPEVEEALLHHPAVAECAVVGVADAERGQIVKAFVVPRAPAQPGEALAQELQAFVKAEIAPYKYPRAIAFLEALPRTETGKLQRFRLRGA